MFRNTMIGGLAVAASLAATAAPAWASPANDDWEHAAVLGDAPVTVDGTLDGATAQGADPIQAPSVWYAYRPTASGPVAVELPARDRHVADGATVYAGTSHADLHPVSVRDDRWYGRSRFDAVGGQTYWIPVTGYEPDGDFTLSVRPVGAPGNDTFAGARRLRVPSLFHGNLEDATTELGETGVPEGASTVWFTIRPKHTGRLTVDTTGSGAPVTVGAFTGWDVSSLRRVKEGARVIRFTAQRGRTYRLRLTARGGDTGAYVLDVSDGSIAGKGVHMTVLPGQTVGSVRRHGLRLDVGARRKVGVSIDLLVSRRTARHLGLRGTVLGHVRGTLGYGEDVPATVRLSAAARRALAGRDGLKATLRLTLLDHAPNRVLTVPVTL